jgi:hypothetical protein
MIVPLLPVAAAVTIGATFVGILASIIPRISNISEPAAVQGAIEPIVGGMLAVFALGVIVFFAELFFGALSFYYLIDRRNRHFTRQQALFTTLHQYLTSKAPSSENIPQLGFLSQDFALEEQMRPAGLWAVLFLFVTPIVGLVTSYSLTQDLRRHDELQSKYQAALTSSLIDAGFQQPSFPRYDGRNRDPVLLIILSAITGGLFWIYWFYTLLKDYNDHFSNQAKFEDELFALLRPMPTQKICGSCGGLMPTSARFCPSCGKQQVI